MYVLKQQPEDFIVKELLDVPLQKHGRFAYFLLRKKKWTTLKVIEELANKLHANPRQFAVAGMKDKYGITEQWVSAEKIALDQLATVSIKDVTLIPKGYANERIRLGSLRGNQFTITIRKLEQPLQETLWMPNYYDEQRFGDVRPNTHLVGKALLRRDFEGALKTYLCKPFPTETKDFIAFRNQLEKRWGDFRNLKIPKAMFYEYKMLRKLQRDPKNIIAAFKVLPRQLLTLFVQAYQSWLFNEALRTYLQKSYAKMREVQYSAGSMTFLQEEIHEEDRGLEIPFIGTGLVTHRDSISEILKALMMMEKIKPEDFRFTHFQTLTSKSLLRRAFVKIKHLTLDGAKPDEKNQGFLQQTVTFDLPKGSYATVAIKALSAASS